MKSDLGLHDLMVGLRLPAGGERITEEREDQGVHYHMLTLVLEAVRLIVELLRC